MPVRVLEHVNIRTVDLTGTIAFYELLGLKEGPRPSTRKGGWLYDARDVPVIHLAFYDPDDAEQRAHVDRYLGEKQPHEGHGSGTIDHVAFGAVGYEDTAALLRERGHDLRERVTPSGLPQIFVTDPNGIVVELNFNDERRAA